jgi:HPt (histidine-containing phosphotransfer) domain-containing protein
MTANAMAADREKALEAGMDDYIPKPVKPQELDAALQRWLSRAEVLESTQGGEETVSAEDSDGTPDGTLDARVIENLREIGGQEMISELAEMFLDDARSAIDTLKEAVEGGDARTVRRAAHTLKGSSGNMGAGGMARVCARLEEVGAANDLVDAPGLLARLEEEFDRVYPALISLSQSSRGDRPED